MTSLSRQLAAIQAKSTSELDLKAQRVAHSRSLLFEPKVAANQSFDVIYQICYEGFEELCALDSRFIRFERSIFAPHSKSQDRQLMTVAENKDLDGALEAFLSLVGGRLLLKPAIKAVEWLIRRFHVHEQNHDALILTFLPYHLTPIFPTLLSILPKQLNPIWKFLYTYINHLKSPPRSVLVNAATQNQAFFAAVNRYVLTAAEAGNTYPTLLSFWASIAAQAVNDMFDTSLSGRKAIQSQREEELMTRIVPTLSEGLAMQHNPELVLGCYIIITVLVSKANLNDQALDALMAAVLQSSTRDTVDSALSCAAVIAEKRDTITLPRSITKSFLKVEGLGNRLLMIAAQQPVQKLVVALVQGTIARLGHEESESGIALLEHVATHDFLPASTQDAVIRHIRDLATRMLTDNENNVQVQRLIQSIEATEEDTPVMAIEDRMEVDEVENDDELPVATAVKPLSIPEEARNRNTKLSFFSESATATFQTLLGVYEHAVLSPELRKEFAELEILSTPTAKFTFFARVWTSSASNLARSAALQATGEHIKLAVGSESDHQDVLPYLLVALSDGSAKIRRRAAAVVRVMMSGSEAAMKPSNHVEFYLATGAKDHKRLSAKDFAAFIHVVLMSSLEECVSDANHMSRLISSALSSSSNSDDKSAERLKTAQKAEVSHFLTSHLLYTTSIATQLFLLSTLNKPSKIAGYMRSRYLLPYWRQWVAKDVQAIGDDHRTRVDAETLEIAHGDDPDSMTFLMSLCLEAKCLRKTYRTLAFHRLIVLWPNLRMKAQTTITEALLDAALRIVTEDGDDVVHEQSSVVLKSVRIQSEVLSTFLEKAIAELSHRDQPSAARRRRTSGRDVAATSEDTEHSKHAVARLTLVVELVDSQRSGLDINLFYALFKLLQALQDFRTNNTMDLGYVQNLALSSLSTIMSELNKKKGISIDASRIRADLLVDCVRNTTSIQARSSALLLLSELTRYIPQAVLHSIMPIFTLMSATTIRQDDDFSAHVVDQTIQQVVPLLAQSLRDQKKDLVAATAEIILSFAAAFEHIAAHRRLQLYRLLAASLGASESLFAVIATLVDHFANSTGQDMQRDEVAGFVIELFRQFQSTDGLATAVKLIELSLDSLQSKPTISQTLLKQESGYPMTNITRVLAVLPTLLEDSTFRRKLKADLKDESKAALRQYFAQALEGMLKLSKAASKAENLRPLCSRTLESLLTLFPLNELATSVEPLLSNADQDIRRSVLKTLEIRVRTSKNIDGAQKQAVMHLLPRLLGILQDKSNAHLKPNALAAIDQICEKFGKSDMSAILEVAEIIAGPSCIGSSDDIIRVLSLHCLASVVGILEAEVIPILQQVMQQAMDCLRLSMQKTNTSLHAAAYAFFTALADSVPFMISKTALRQVVELSFESAAAQLGAEEDENRKQFLQLVATKVEIATVLDVLPNVWAHAATHGVKVSPLNLPLRSANIRQSVHDHLDILHTLIDNHSKTSISRHAPAMFKVFVAAFDVRHDCASSTASDVDTLEAKLIENTLAFVFKINDTIFRPFFTQLLDWSALSTSKRGSSQQQTLRSTTFFNLITALSERLKSIFTSYFSYVVDRSKDILLLTTSSKPALEQQQLRLSVLKALHSGFKHDQDDFWASPSNFIAIMPALVTQLASIPAAQATSDLIPAITALAVANDKSADHYKSLNTELLKSLRHDSSRVRLAAVRTQIAIVKELGDDWMSVLPELLPALSELQDDDDDTVARETNVWIKTIGDTLGEDIQSMLQ
jgi:U3 small nucleolar RNA-associated protein 10